MDRLFYTMAAITILMVLIAGTGAFLISKTFIAQSKVDAVSSTAKSVALALSEQINLLNNLLDKMAQDPDVIASVAQKDPALMAKAASKLESHFPGALSVKFLVSGEPSLNINNKADMGFADLEMARKTFESNQPTAIQGDVKKDRHLAITRRILQDNKAIGVVLVGVNYDFIDRILRATPLEKGYIELKQGKLVLASTGEKNGQDEITTPPIRVPNTDWELFYDNKTTSFIEQSLIACIVIIPALVVALAFTTGYRKASALLNDDVAWVIKAVKDIVTEKPMGEYPVKLAEMKHVISTLSQFKRLVNDKWFEI